MKAPVVLIFENMNCKSLCNFHQSSAIALQQHVPVLINIMITCLPKGPLYLDRNYLTFYLGFTVVSANCLHCYAESVTCRDDVTETRMRVTHQACILRNYAEFCWWRCLIMSDALGDALPVWWLSCQVRWAVVASAPVVCVWLARDTQLEILLWSLLSSRPSAVREDILCW